MEEKKEYNYLFKILILGDSFVGKTNMLKRFLDDEFESNTKETVGVEYGSKNFTMEKGDVVNAQLWDTAGQERYRSMTKAYYKGAKGALLVYDLTRRSTFDNIDNWIIDLKTNCDKDMLIMIIGNKSDLEEERDVSKDEAQAKAEQYNIAYMETSAKNGDNINKAFHEIIEQIYNNADLMAKNDATIGENNGEGVNLSNKEEEEKKKSGCC